MAYNWDPYEIYGVRLRSLWNAWRTTEITMKFMAYNWNSYEIYGVQLKSVWNTLEIPDQPDPPSGHKNDKKSQIDATPEGSKTSEIPDRLRHTMKFMAYNWNPYEIYGVQLKSLWNLWRTIEIPIKTSENAGSAEAHCKIYGAQLKSL